MTKETKYGIRCSVGAIDLCLCNACEILVACMRDRYRIMGCEIFNCWLGFCKTHYPFGKRVKWSCYYCIEEKLKEKKTKGSNTIFLPS